MGGVNLHLGELGIGRGLATMLLSDARLVLAQVLTGSMEGLFGHFEGCVGVFEKVVEGQRVEKFKWKSTLECDGYKS